MDVSLTSRFANNLFAKRLKSFRQHVRLVSYISPDHYSLKVKEVNTCALDFFVSLLKNKVYSREALVLFLKRNDLRR